MTSAKPGSWPPGTSEMAQRIRAHDWAATPLGPSASWPASLRTMVELILASGFPMIILWGPRLLQLYNDGYRDLMHAKHPGGLGQPTEECWPEVWRLNAPIYERVRAGETVTIEDGLYPIKRHGGLTDAWFTVSYSPLRNETEEISGVLVTLVETTERVRAEAALQRVARFTQAQNAAFEAAMDGAALADSLGILSALVHSETCGEARTAFYLGDADGALLRPVRGTGDMSEAYLDVVDGFRIGEDSLSCGLAVPTGQPVITPDVQTDARWTPWVWMSHEFDFRGCWSFPLKTRDRQAVGTFAM